MQDIGIRSLGREDPLEEEMATHSSIFAWRIPRTEEPGVPQSMVSQRVRFDWASTHQGILQCLMKCCLGSLEQPCQSPRLLFLCPIAAPSLFSSPSQPCTDSPSLHGWHSSFSIPRGGSLSLSNVCLWISSYWNNPQVGQSMVIQITASFWEAPDAGTCRHWRRIIVPSLFAEQLLLYYRGSNTPLDKSDLWLHLFTQSLPGELWHCPSSASPRRQFENSLHFDETGSS